MWEAAAGLEPRQLAILELTVRADLSTAELATALDVRPAHAAVLAHRARSALGHAVRLLLLARNPRRCRRLAELVPTRPRTLSRAQRASVDRHVRRCPECCGLARTLTAPLSVLGVLLAAWDRDTAPAVATTSSRVAKAGALAAVAGLAITAAVWLLPDDPPAPRPAPSRPHRRVHKRRPPRPRRRPPRRQHPRPPPRRRARNRPNRTGSSPP
ncbi:hypothetical protein ACFQV2_17300 [Actinokineospora soli]|uniref:Zinc-finger n=1 Tax=Actinokineospora soli TaxID=1048753 RepID=A0ABW2TNP2_9PSEU